MVVANYDPKPAYGNQNKRAEIEIIVKESNAKHPWGGEVFRLHTKTGVESLHSIFDIARRPVGEGHANKVSMICGLYNGPAN